MSKKILLVLILVLVLSACTLRIGGSISTDSGFYYTTDQGEKWVQSVELFRVGEGRAFFRTAQSIFLKVDPQDPNAFYLGTIEDGLLYSFHRGLAWQKTLSSKGVVRDLAIDPQDKCTLYAAVGNSLYKSEDCSRNWEVIHLEGLPNQVIRSVAVDNVNNNKVYIGTTGGRLYKSLDAGVSWELYGEFDSSVQKILINPNNSAQIYVATLEDGLYKSNNEAMEWFSITNQILAQDKDSKGEVIKRKNNKYYGVNFYLDLELDLSQPDALIYANHYGLFYSANGGTSWQEMKLLTPPETVKIRAVAINPKNNQEIYYATPNAFYKTINGGTEWTTEKLPTTKVPVDLLVDSEDAQRIYMVVREIDE